MGQHVPFDPQELNYMRMNNFFAHFCVGEKPYPCHTPQDLYRRSVGFEQFAGRTYRESMGDAGEWPEWSDKKLAQTPEEFYAEFDRTIEETGLDKELVARAINVYVHDTRAPNCLNEKILTKNLYELLAPIYIALREKGYNPADLVS